MNRHPERRRLAFTLVEMLVVIAIIGVLAALVVGINSFARTKAFRSKTLASMEKVRNALEDHRLERGYYPAFTNTGQTVSTNWNVLTNYAKDFTVPESFQDAWGNSFQYACPPSSFQYRLWSTGPNAADAADDVDPSAGNQ
jgi:general secretion pathway protein G